ncbi:hypothetical protein MTR_1g028490 [Medicago truncatula]|uniref:Uncharacterized protein n=1 Tax=Medicago truncatula TaxID=3880 RepID=A0A072VEJ6_MEDTR|nr:hypothetical protein MTR_1g028490 [Medicago truncatula]
MRYIWKSLYRSTQGRIPISYLFAEKEDETFDQFSVNKASIKTSMGFITGGLSTFVDVSNGFGAPAIVEDPKIRS